MNLIFRNSNYIIPPGAYKEILTHPNGGGAAVELAVFQQHRFALFFWAQWTNKRSTPEPPCLVSIDWHQDLCYPGEIEQGWLNQLDVHNEQEVAGFCWATLSGNNDDHVLAAAYLNLVGNIYVHCRQGIGSEWEDEQLVDKFGNTHLVKKFRTVEALQAFLHTSDERAVYFDLDLDYFAIKEAYGKKVKRTNYMTPEEISTMLAADAPLMNWVFERLAGFTLATEPEHCGGLLKSNELLDTIDRLYFKPGLLSKNCNWKHLRESE